VATRHDYSQQARSYDTTRAASPSVLDPLRRALEALPGPVVVDVGGGTGNYSAALRDDGLLPTVSDLSPAMLEVARAKGLPAVRADATALPFGPGSVDAVALISMLHHVPDWRRALDGARRLLRPGGRLVLLAFGREHLDVHWITRYFPATTAYFVDAHQPLAELADALPGATVTPVRYDDLVDGSMAAMCRRPETLLDPSIRRQTSYFERAERDFPDELAAGIGQLERDLAGGRRPEREVDGLRARIGDATLLTWRSP
jgi:ubiquinone/menaquinone biosynthesis C-methylase UbiE